MAWQGPADSSGNGSNGGPVGTEYTLQGVMRFLQTQFHRHERDRNSWEIERADMKARIAKMEGDNRAAKMMQQAYATRVKMLEAALKREREKNKGISTDGGSQVTPGTAERDANVTGSHELDSSLLNAPLQSEQGRQKSRIYLEKCLQEITYLLTPPTHPPPQAQKQEISPSQKIPQNHQPAQDFLWLQSQARHALLPQQGPPPAHQAPPRPQPPGEMPLNTGYGMSENHLFQSQGAGAMAQAKPAGDANSMYGSEALDLGRFQTAGMKGAGFEKPSQSTEVLDDKWDFDEPSKAEQSAGKSGEGTQRYGSIIKHPGISKNSTGKRKASLSRRQEGSPIMNIGQMAPKTADGSNFKVRFALRGHLDVIRAVVFTGGGTASEPEICTAGDDGVLKRWIIPGGYNISTEQNLDVQSHFTHRGHAGIVTSLAAAPTLDSDGWVFSGGQDYTVKVWENGKVDAKATLEGHTDTVWSVCVLPTASTIAGDSSPGNILIASGSADGTVKIWSVTAPRSRDRGTALQLRKKGRKSFSEESEFSYSLISTIPRPDAGPAPTSINLLSITGANFIVSYDNAQIVVYDTLTCEELVQMSSQETYDGTKATGVNSVVCSTLGLEQGSTEEEEAASAPTGRKEGIEGLVFSGHEDGYIRFYDANSGQCTYTMLAHPSAVASLALSPDGRELVSAGHDASLRFWSLETRSCTQELTTHRLMRGEGVCAVVWSADGRWVVSGGGDGVAKVLSR